MTQPIKYAKHKQSKRVPFTIVLVWAISAAIGIPIATGLNKVEGRNEQLCVLYHSDFIIYSSISSFYIPCIIMVILYYKIFKVIRERARKAADSAKRSRSARNAGTIENTAVTLTLTDGATDARTEVSIVPTSNHGGVCNEEPTNTGSGSQESTSGEHVHPQDRLSVCNEDGDDNDHHKDVVIANQRPLELNSPQSEDGQPPPNSDSGYCAPTGVEIETRFGTTPSSPKRTFLTPPKTQVAAHTVVKNNGTTGKIEHKKVLPLPKNVTKFNFCKTKRSGSKKRKDKLAAKKEKKATKTLAIVLGKSR